MGRTHLRVIMALAACLVVLLVLPGAASAHDSSVTGPPGPVVADLAGHTIAVGEIPHWYCHDLDFPRIHCFATAAELEHALATHQSARPAGTAGASIDLAICADANWQGGTTVISQAYPDLGTIGWNDKISSFKVLNGVAGHFATDIYNSGAYDYFAPYQLTTYVGNAWNDTFSSVYPG